MKNWLLVIAMAVLLAGCAEPLPENRLEILFTKTCRLGKVFS